MKRLIVLPGVIAFFVLVINSCTKLDSTTLGGDFIPGSDRLITDTTSLSVTTTSFIINDTNYIDKREDNVAGYINDPLFGTTTGSMFFQLLPPFQFAFPVRRDSLFYDSAVLSIQFNGTYGDTTALTKLNVYKITDPTFSPKRRYGYNEGISFSTADFLGTTTFKTADVRRGRKLAYKTDSVFNQLRIRISDALGQLILQQDTITGALKNDSAFKAFLNGLAVVPDSTVSGNALHYFRLNNASTRLNLYYRYRRRDGTLDTTVTNFGFVPDTLNSAGANKLYRNYNGGTALPVLTSNTPASLAYVQAGPGTGVRIKAPGINTLVGRNYLVHRAELIVRQVYQGPLTIENTLVPPILHLYTIGADGKNATIPIDSTGYFQFFSFDPVRNVLLFNINTPSTGGIPSYTTDASGNRVAEYRIPITRYVQNILNGKTTLRDFVLEAPYFANYSNPTYNISSSGNINPVGFGRLQAGGGSHPQYPMVVRIYYSKQ
ncbi:MAG TPA: DUF4270 family protein [Lacibacter sp.]|nr:DUF4270 family protein [Lacibacter sp.]